MVVRNYVKNDRDQITKIVLELQKYYPTVRQWLLRQIEKIEKGEIICKVAELGGKIAGVAISGRKNEYCVKLKTFKIADEFQGLGIGPRLLEEVIDYWVNEKVRKIYVTFAEEEVDELLSFFQEYGFLFDGVSPFAYRKDVSEYIMSKLQVYSEITEEEFADFIWNYLFRLRGYRKIEEGKDFLVLQKLISLKEAYKIFVKIVTDLEPSKKLGDEMVKEAEKLKCPSRILVSYYPLPFEVKNRDIKVIDGYDIETLFYPVVLRRQKYAGLISSIEEKYAKRILYDPTQTLLSADKKSLRVDKVFYKYPQAFKEIRRGSTFVFYESEPISAITGEGKIKEVILDAPENLYEKYEKKGVLTLKDIQTFADRQNRVLAISLGRIIRYKDKIPLYTIQEIRPNFNPQGASFISQGELDKLRELGGVRIK